MPWFVCFSHGPGPESLAARFTIGQKIYGTQVSIGTYMLASPKGHEASAAAEAGGGLVSANRQAVERRDEQILRI